MDSLFKAGYRAVKNPVFSLNDRIAVTTTELVNKNDSNTIEQVNIFFIII